MQKSLVILLAVCLISVHAFVKRETPTAASDANYFENLQKQIGEFTEQLTGKFKSTFNPEEMNKGFNNVVSSVNKAFTDLKPTPEPKKD